MRAQMPPVNDNRSNYLQKQNKVLSQVSLHIKTIDNFLSLHKQFKMPYSHFVNFPLFMNFCQ